MRRLPGVLLVLVLVGAACGDDDDAATPTTTTTTSTSVSVTTTSTTAPTTTTTTAFEGSTDPTDGAATAAGSTLLTDVQVSTGRVAFVFREGTPGYRVEYTSDPITADGSGEPVAVEGDAHLSVRFEPASGYDMEAGAESYGGSDRIAGEDPITEVVRTGDFEAVLSWVVGLTDERPFRVEAEGSTVTILFAV